MAKTGTRIYVDSDSGTGLTISEIKSVLGESSLDLGTLCKSSKVNPLAKYKPVNVASWGELTEAQRKTAEYGIGPTEYSTNEDTAITKMWAYEKPTSYFRALDFDGYRHDAKFGLWAKDGSVSMISTSGTMLLMSGSREGDLSLADFLASFTAFKDWYLCVVIKNGNYTYYKTTSKTIGEMTGSTAVGGDCQITITPEDASTITKGNVGSASFYVLLSTKSATSLASSLVGNFCSLPIFEGQSYNDRYGGTITVTASLPDTITYQVTAVQATYVPTKTNWSSSPSIPTELVEAGATEDQWGGYFGMPGTPPSGYTIADMVAYFSTPSGNASFQISIQNSDSTPFTLSTANLKAQIVTLSHPAVLTPNPVAVTFYDPVSLSQVDTITVPAKGAMTYYVSLPQGHLSPALTTSGRKARARVSIILDVAGTKPTVFSFPCFNFTNA